MKSDSSTRPRFRWAFLCGLLWTALAGHAAAASTTLKVAQAASDTEASIRDYQVVTFRISYAVTSTTQDALKSTITFKLNSNFELVGMAKSAIVKSSAFDNASRTGTFTFEDTIAAGVTGEVSVQVRFAQSTPADTLASFQPTFGASNATAVSAGSLTVKAINPPSGGGGGPVFVKGVSVSKYGDNYVSAAAPWYDYSIRHGNTGPAGFSVPSYAIEDIFPAGLMLQILGTDRWGGTSNDVTVKYRTNKNAAWRTWGGGPLYNTGDSSGWHWVDELALPATEWVTGLRLEYGTLPGGGSFHPDNMWNFLFMRLGPAPGSKPPASYRNCATASGTSVTSDTGCKDSTVTPGVPNFYHWTNYDAKFPVEMGESFTINGYLGQNYDSTADMVNPTFIAELPPAFEYVGNFKLQGSPWDNSAKMAPLFQQLDNFNGSGSTLLRWRWGAANPFTIAPIKDYTEIKYSFDVRVRPGTPNGNYQYWVYASWQKPLIMLSGWQIMDTRDLDDDGLKFDLLLTDRADLNVETNGGLASLSSTMLVKGEKDTGWSKFPATGLTVPSGKADYQLSIVNEGGVIMKDPVIIDILPALGDTGVIDTSARGSAWEPFLADAVTAPPGITVFYSLSRNPCRNELTPGLPVGCEDPKWTALLPTDITKVKSLKFDGTGLKLNPLDRVEIAWPMRAPIGAPTKGEITWNSFGFIARRADDNSSTLATEPVKTGIAVKNPDPPYYGDRVWIDGNRNGVQDAGEVGLNGVRIDLFRDNGDKVADPANDILVTFTVTSTSSSGDGAYRFGNIGVGSYFAVVTPPDDYAVTIADAGGDDSKDSDGQPITYKGHRAAIFPVTQLVDLEDDTSWDLGVFDRSGIPSVWAVAPQADGKLVVGGKFISSHGIPRRNIARVDGAGKTDLSFNPGTGFDGSVRSLAIRGDGLIWAGGNFTTYNKSASMGVALIKPDGTFAGGTAEPDTAEVNWVGINGGTMYLAGAFGKIGGAACGNIAALKVDGSVNTGFAILPGANAGINGGAVLGDGKLVLVGAFTSYGSLSRNRVVRVNKDGTVDPSFDPGAGANGEVYSVKLIDDGRIVLTGAFTSFAGVKCNGTIRLLASGKPDATLAPSALAVKSINASN